MLNQIVLEKNVGGNKQADTGRTVEVYNYNASDLAGQPPAGTKIGNASEISSTGVYTFSLTESMKCTIVVDGLVLAGLIGVLLDGEQALDGSVDTTALADSAVTPTKTSFASDF